jgi:DNA-binding beta-propeller fold protein YncE
MQARRRSIAALVVAASLPTLSGAAGAADGDPSLKSCYSTGNLAPCVQLQPPFTAEDAELGPGGRHLYVAVGDPGGGYNGLRLFDVATGGTITPRPGPAAATQEVPHDLDFNADGKNVYVAAGSYLAVFQRDTITGALAQTQCFGPSPCTAVSGANSFFSVALDPDGRNVYARGVRQLTVFDRDPATGALSQKPGIAGCVTEEAALPCANAVGIAGGGLETVVSPDGRHVYVSNDDPGGVAVFNRDSSGTLGQLPGTAGGCITVGGTSGSAGGTECATGSPTLSQARAANLDAQGAFVVVSGAGGNTVFRRDAVTGTLTQTDCLDEVGGGSPPADCHEVKGAAGTDAALTPDGRDVVLNASEFGLSFLTLDRTTGKVAQRTNRGCVSAVVAAPCVHVPGLMGGGGGVTFSPTGMYVFAAFHGGSVAGFERDLGPRCQSRTITLRRRMPFAVKLTCANVNADNLRLEIAAPPTYGTLGQVDQRRDRVLYTPPPRRKGKDSFRYRGNILGSRGPASTITLNVVAAPARTDRTPPNTHITAGPLKTTTSRTVRFSFRSTERGSDFQCRPDWRKRWASCRSPKSYANLRRGRHSFLVRAIDGAGNVDRTPAKRVWVVR